MMRSSPTSLLPLSLLPVGAALLMAALVLAPVAAADEARRAEPVHGLAMHGDLDYGPDFEHFAYAEPNAPKGGSITFAAIGTFDSLNPFIVRGVSAAGIGTIYDTLTSHARDEPFSEYGLLALSIEMPEDRSWVAYTLRPEARWHDGRPVTVDDVIFTLETLKTRGHPFYRAYYANVVSAEKAGERRVVFNFDGRVNRELPLIVGQMPILPKHHYEAVEFDRTTLTPPLGSGPYRVRQVDPGRSIVYERVPDYWGRDIPVNRGRHNFDEVRYEYYRDADIALEAFKAGQFDIRIENTAKNWATGYTGPAIDAGMIKLEEFADESGDGMQGFVFNTRRWFFQDPKVRRALAFAFDFEWTNQNLFYGQYKRTHSYFSGSELAASELPGEAELALLEPFRDRLPEEVFTTVYAPPESDGSGNIRANLRTALQLLREAGWEVQGGRLVHQESGRPMEFEILLVSPAFERISLPFTRNLEQWLGIRANVRTVDTAQYQNRTDSFDFDMVVTVWGQSLSPGNEQRDFWGSEAAVTHGSRNLAGIEDEVVDHLIDRIITADSREGLVAATRALDRVLQWGHYVIPHWHSPTTRIAYWDKIAWPETLPRFGLDLFAWWVDGDKERRVAAWRSRAPGARAATQN
jgi:microcin C transport system substrate-binding protein